MKVKSKSDINESRQISDLQKIVGIRQH